MHVCETCACKCCGCFVSVGEVWCILVQCVCREGQCVCGRPEASECVREVRVRVRERCSCSMCACVRRGMVCDCLWKYERECLGGGTSASDWVKVYEPGECVRVCARRELSVVTSCMFGQNEDVCPCTLEEKDVCVCVCAR